MSWILCLLANEKGQPDESALAFLLALCTLIAGAFLRAFGHGFPLAEFASAVCALIPLYKLAKGDWRR